MFTGIVTDSPIRLSERSASRMIVAEFTDSTYTSDALTSAPNRPLARVRLS